MRAMICWASLQYMHVSENDDSFPTGAYIEKVYEAASIPCGLFETSIYNSKVSRSNLKPIGWFTSL